MLTRETWPSVAAVEASLAARFSLPPLPPAMHDWLAWCRAAGDRAMHLEDFGTLTGVRTVDPPSLLRAMDGYRFVLDQRASTPEALVWHDQSNGGGWQPHWVVLQNHEGDPLIGDLRDPAVPVLQAAHGMGHWAPEPMFDSLHALMAAIEVYTPLPGGDGPPTLFYTVRLADLGPQPMRVLTALKDHPDYAEFAGARLLQLRQQLPLTLLEDNVSAALKDHWAGRFEALGARVEVTQRVLPR